MVKHPVRFLLGGLLAGWLVDLLFWQTSPGISIPIWVILATGMGVALTFSEGLRPSRWSYVLMALAILFAVLSVAREQAFSSAINLLMSIFLLALLTATLRSGNWVAYRMMDSFLALLRVAGATLVGFLFFVTRKRPESVEKAGASSWRQKLGQAAPLLRGLLLAVPVLLVLGGLLVSADPMFGQQIEGLFSWLKFENFEDFLFRLFYIGLWAYVMIGIYVHAAEHNESRPDVSKQALAPFLGFTETSVVLVLVDLMFLLFVGIQFIYLFGGQANINTTGFTYADYARRGFFELVGVAVLSLMLYLTLGYVTRRESKKEKRWFTILVVVELLLVGVMLVSAFQRMALYQSAYGFSQLRVQVVVLMIWLAVLLAATIVLELLGRSRHFGLAALLFCVGFVLTMGVFNMDGHIAEQNIERARQGAEFDAAYLDELSADAVPVLYAQFSSGTLSPELKKALGNDLACRSQRLEYQTPQSWLSFRFSKQAAEDLLRAHAAEFQEYDCLRYDSY